MSGGDKFQYLKEDDVTFSNFKKDKLTLPNGRTLGSIFGCEGRFTRSEYFFYTYASTLLYLLAGMVVGFILGITSVLFGFELSQNLITTVVNILYIPFFILSCCIIILRFHDLGRSGRFILGLIIPFYNLYLLILLCFVKGTDGKNEYGNEFKPNDWLTYGAILLFLVIILINFLI